MELKLLNQIFTSTCSFLVTAFNLFEVEKQGWLSTPADILVGIM